MAKRNLTKNQLYRAILFANEVTPGDEISDRIHAIIWLYQGKKAFMDYVRDCPAWCPEIGEYAYNLIHDAYKARRELEEHLNGEES